MPFIEISKQLIFPSGRTKFLLSSLIIILLILGYLIVKATGGTAFAYLHILYIPIILAGLAFSAWGGIIVGLIAGFLLGPYMPTNYAYEIAQPLSSWLLRMIMFALVGAMAGLGSSLFRVYIKELELKHITDPVSGLPNLNGLIDIFTKLILPDEKPVTVIVIEVHHMQEIDAAIGGEGTDTLMQQVAHNLKEAVGEDGILGRLHTARFAVLVPEKTLIADILKRCADLSESKYVVNTIPLFIEMRFGVSQYPDDDRDLSHLTRKALIAINRAQSNPQHVSHFDKKLTDSSERNLLILHQLKAALDEKTLIMEYQPKVTLKTGKAMGFEALIRWSDPLLGSVSPMDFIPLVEETFLINPLTRWVLDVAGQQLHQWHKKGMLVSVSVNLSIKNILDPSIIDIISQLLEKYQIPPQFLEVEVTETSVASSISTIATALRSLRDLGVKIAIDDFGTGQASQQYLFELPITALKIDKLFVQSIAHNSAAAVIVKNAISLAHELNLQVIAEGVETRHQYDLLAQWGCDIGQGYLMGKSMKGAVATQWLKENLKSNDSPAT